MAEIQNNNVLVEHADVVHVNPTSQMLEILQGILVAVQDIQSRVAFISQSVNEGESI